MAEGLLSAIDGEWLTGFRRGLVKWYAKHGRVLPWRGTKDAYRIWVSEVMLQQTTVAAVGPYFERFLGVFPTVAALAGSDESEVLKLWEGLGYYSRARNLRRGAQRIVEEHGGEFPREVAALRELPGIGRYTAGAIASFAFDESAPIVEANTKRLYCRLLGYEGDPRGKEGERLLWSFAERVLPRRGAGEMNQALMDLGSQVCRVKGPECEGCPVRRYCRAFREGTQGRIPRLVERAAPTEMVAVCLVGRREGRYLMRRYAAWERWGGLWDFPRWDVPAEVLGEERSAGSRTGKRGGAKRQSLRGQKGLFDDDEGRNRVGEWGCMRLVEEAGVRVGKPRWMGEFRHTVTRYRYEVMCFEVEVRGGELKGEYGESRWCDVEAMGEMALSVPARKIADLLSGLRKG